MSFEIWKRIAVSKLGGIFVMLFFLGVTKRGEASIKIDASGFKHLKSLKYHYWSRFKII